MGRGVRIHHKKRIKNKRKSYHSLKHGEKGHEHPCRCSCFLCGNPRKYAQSLKDKLTIQERKHEHHRTLSVSEVCRH